MKVSRVLAMMLCIMIMANCLVVAAAASGNENVGGGYWAWETVPGFMAKIVLSAPRSETFGIGTGGCRWKSFVQ